MDWRQISEKLDVIAHEAWLTQDESKAYEWNEIKCRLEQLRTIPLRTDLKTIADTLRAGKHTYFLTYSYKHIGTRISTHIHIYIYTHVSNK